MSLTPTPPLPDAALVESMTESVLITTAELELPGPFIVYVNPAFERMTGWSRQEVVGRTPRVLQGPRTDHAVFANLREELERAAVWEGQTINYRRDGSEFVMEWSIVPLRGAAGEITHYLAVQRDVTRRVKLERELAAARQVELDFAAQLEQASHRLTSVNEEQERTLNLFMKYVPEPVVRKALEHRGSGDVFGGQLLHATLLFCDLRNFTGHSEALHPARVVRLLNTYYRQMAEVIRVHDGTIQQFVGDEIFVTFGAPVPVRHGEEKAVRCAIGMVQQLQSINAELAADVAQALEIRIGIHAGEVVAGNLGSDERLAYSITGDAVNTAKRIESLAREGGNTILVSGLVHEHVAALVDSRPWASAQLKGKRTLVSVFQVLGLRESPPSGCGG